MHLVEISPWSVDVVEFGAGAMPTGSRWASNNYITRCHRPLESVETVPVAVGVSWGTRCQRENQLADWELVALRTPGWAAQQNEEEVLLWSENLGSMSGSLSPSPTHLSHITNINPFANKVWEVYFSKEVCSFIIIVDYVSECICICIVVSWLYNTTSIHLTDKNEPGCNPMQFLQQY